MADFDNTALNSVIPEIWDEKVEEARYATAVIMERVANRSTEVAKFGDVLHVSIDQTYTVGTVSAAGGFTPQNYALTTADITLNQWNQISVQILDRAQSQAFWTPASSFPKQAGKAFANTYDSSLAGLWSSVASGNTVGDPNAPSAFDKTLAQEAMARFAATNIPVEEQDVSFCLHPNAYYLGLTNEAQLTAADASGMPKNVLTTGYKFPLFGVPVYLSTNIVSTGTPSVHKNLLLHRSALGIAWQRKNEVEHTRTTANLVLADLYVMQALWGYAVIRSDHFVVINSAAS